MTSISVNAQSSSEVNSSNIGRMIDQLGPNDKITITRSKDGTVSFHMVTAKGDRRTALALKSTMTAYLRSEPVKPGWMSFSEEPDEPTAKLSKEHRKEIRAKTKEIASKKEVQKAVLEMVLAFKSINDAPLVTTSGGTYRMFTIGEQLVYTNENKVPMMYRDGERGELKFV